MPDYLNRILSLVLSPEFIVGTLIFGLLLSVVGNALYDGGKRLLGQFSTRQRARNEKEKQHIDQEARKCVGNPSHLMIRLGDTDYWTAWAGIYWTATAFILSVYLLVFATTFQDSISRFLRLDIAAAWGTMTTPFQQPYILRIPITKIELWFRLGMMAAGFVGVYTAKRASDYNRRSLYCRRIVNRARAMLNEQAESGRSTDQ